MSEYFKTKTTFFHLDQENPGAMHLPPALLHEPEVLSEKSKIGIVVVHHSADYLTFTPGPELAKRGYRVLCANTVGSTLDQKIEDVRKAVNRLRMVSGIEKVILMGHSGGSTLMGAYQAVAENGEEIFRGQDMVYKFPKLEKKPEKADGMMMLDANFGNSVMTLFSLDPAVTDENKGIGLNDSIDMFSPKNGFDHHGCHYTKEFISMYQKAQGERMNRLVDLAQSRLDAIEKGKGYYQDDEPFVVAGSSLNAPNNKLLPQVVELLSKTKKEYPLLHKDGSVTTQIVPCLRPQMNYGSLTGSYKGGAAITTVRTFLGSYGARIKGDFWCGENDFGGVDFDTCYNSAIASMRHVSAPLLAMGMTGGYEYLAAEFIYETAKSADKTIGFVEGANHNFQPAKECEKVPGQFGDTVKLLFDHVDKWLSANGRFM